MGMMCELGERFHVGVIGGGIAGLAAAQLLVGHSSVRVTVLEGATQLGGRAGVLDGGEHCTRFFLDDYLYMLALMRDVPTGTRTLADALVPVQRIVGMNGRLVEVDHAYPAFDAGLRPADRLRLMRSTVTSYLVARRSAANTNSFGHAYNYSLRDLVWIVRNMAGSERARVLSGPTDKEFLEPWVKHLRDSGVVIQTDTRVGRVILEPRGVRVLGVGLDRRFDAVLVATSASDCADLLDASGMPRLLDWRQHANCMCLTINLDPREPVLTDARPASG